VTDARGNYTATIKVVDDNKQSVTQNCTIFITDLPVSWTTNATLPSAKVSVSYADGNLTATGGKPPYTFSIKAGSTLPGNLTLTSNKIIGTPTTAGTYTFTLNVTDSQSPQQSAERMFNLVVESNFTDMVTVQGGTLPVGSGLAGQTVATFQIGKYELTWGEWKTVRDWAVGHGYTDLAGVGGTYPDGAADNFPVLKVSWYDVVKWCNAKSEKEGKTAVYLVNGLTYKSGENSNVTQKAGASGYRLPSVAEWEWAARGGVKTHGYRFSGSEDVNAVAWTYENMGSYYASKAVGTKSANELVIYDMSGNAWEWCWDVFYNSNRFIGGGCWNANAYNASVYHFDHTIPGYRYDIIGFRPACSSGN
jgi:formylglycine-generating enzyme required for sulfatase activity